MLQCNRFSIVTKNYLSRFYDILECMKEGMTNAQLNDSISHNFIVQMIPHHEAAIQMSQNLLQYTTFIPLQNIALGIISEQTQSIENMRSDKLSARSPALSNACRSDNANYVPRNAKRCFHK